MRRTDAIVGSVPHISTDNQFAPSSLNVWSRENNQIRLDRWVDHSVYDARRSPRLRNDHLHAHLHTLPQLHLALCARAAFSQRNQSHPQFLLIDLMFLRGTNQPY